MTQSPPRPEPDPPPRRRRPEAAFLVRFLGLLLLLFLVVASRPVNDAVVEPFTGLVARAGGAACRLLGEPVTTSGTLIASPRFAVNIRNGCNGVETMLIFAAGVLAFPAPWTARLAGLLAGSLLIQAVNVVRIASLFFIGARWPAAFEDWHVVVWQAIVVLFGVVLWILWAHRLALRPRPARQALPG